jgi:tRNA (mo5U34)-methyltransferase
VDVLERAREIDWYHTLELAPGQVTKGIVDLRPHVHKVGLPERMDGRRVREIGTWDGFWAFELERRGAEVLGIDLDWDGDIDWPASRRPDEFLTRGTGFELAKELLGSSVERRNLSVYDATPEELGTFDFVFCGSILIHLRDPVLALERIASVCRDRFVAVEAHHRLLGLLPFSLGQYRALRPGPPVYWEPNVRAWRRMIESAGFPKVESGARFTLRSHQGWKVPHVVLRATKGA